MIALVRWLLKLLKKEYPLAYRYNRAHPHFFWYLGLDAVLSTAIALVGFQLLVAPNPSITENLNKKYVSAPMSASQLVAQVKKRGALVYWYGPKSGYQYTFTENSPGVYVVTYLPPGSDSSDKSQPVLQVKTFDNLAAYEERVHALEELKQVMTPGGSIVTIYKDLPTCAEVIPKEKPLFINACYQTTPTELQVIRDAERLRPI